MGMMMVQEEMITITIFVIYSIGRSFVITYATSAWMSQFFLQSSFALYICAVLNYLHPFTRNKNSKLKLKLCIISGRSFEGTHENAHWRKVQQMQPM